MRWCCIVMAVFTLGKWLMCVQFKKLRQIYLAADYMCAHTYTKCLLDSPNTMSFPFTQYKDFLNKELVKRVSGNLLISISTLLRWICPQSVITSNSFAILYLWHRSLLMVLYLLLYTPRMARSYLYEEGNMSALHVSQAFFLIYALDIICLLHTWVQLENSKTGRDFD